MRRGIALTTAAACITGCGLLFYGSWWLIAVGALCVAFAFLYTAGPYPLAYHGWGDLLVLVFFGFVPVGCTCYILSGSWTWQTGVISAACGLAIDTLLTVNNYRDREQDARSGKRTLVVRLGARAGSGLYLALGFAAATLCLPLLCDGRIGAAALPLLYLAPHTATWRAHGADRPRPGAERHSGRHVAQHPALRNTALDRAAAVKTVPKRTQRNPRPRSAPPHTTHQ